MALKFILLGYMGCGKSTVGQALAKSLQLDHMDLDYYIEQQERASITQLIAEKGIIYFRKVEKKHLETLLKLPNSYVLSLGGGTPCYYNNMDAILKTAQSRSIYLRANVPFLTERLYTKKSKRPLIAAIESKEELAEFIGKHLLERSSFYDQADAVIDIQGKTVAQLVKEINELR